MDYISIRAYAEANDIAERTVRNYCALGKIPGARRVGRTWQVPSGAPLPGRLNAKTKVSPLLAALRRQCEERRKGGIYHRVQIELTYNSNHIEGSRLSKDQTRFIFETNTIGVDAGTLNVDDIIETANHFACVDYIIAHATDPLSEQLVRHLHGMLKSGTSDARKPWFSVGEYKRLPNEVGGMETTLPRDVAAEMRALLRDYRALRGVTFHDVLNFHHRFECIHPFQDGNGRVGRLVMFKECLAHSIVPFIITDELKMFYYRGLSRWPQVPEYLADTCLTAQDHFKELLRYFEIPY